MSNLQADRYLKVLFLKSIQGSDSFTVTINPMGADRLLLMEAKMKQ